MFGFCLMLFQHILKIGYTPQPTRGSRSPYRVNTRIVSSRNEDVNSLHSEVRGYGSSFETATDSLVNERASDNQSDRASTRHSDRASTVSDGDSIDISCYMTDSASTHYTEGNIASSFNAGSPSRAVSSDGGSEYDVLERGLARD